MELNLYSTESRFNFTLHDDEERSQLTLPLCISTFTRFIKCITSYLAWSSRRMNEPLTFFSSKISRYRGICFPGPLHAGNVREDVRTGTTHLLRISVQPFRLRRHFRFHFRGDMVRGEGRLVRPVRPASPAALADIQGHQVLGLAPQPGHIAAQLHAVHHLPAVPALPVHTHLRAARNAAVRRTVQFRLRHSAHQLQHVSDCVVNSVSGM